MGNKQRLEHYRYEDEINAFFLRHAADLLKRHPRTIKRWIRNGKIKGKKAPTSGYWYIQLSEINRVRTDSGLPVLSAAEAISILKKIYPSEAN